MQNRDLIERRYADFYNLYVSDFRQDIACYLDVTAKYPGPVLEVGCGTGRVMAKLAQAGFEVHGVDTARPMLEIARRNLAPYGDRAHIADFDLRYAPLYDGFHSVIVSLYSFNTLIDVEEQRLFLRHMTRSLKSPGVVIFDLFCPLSMIQPEISGEWRVIERSVGEHKLVVRDRRDMLTPLLERRTQLFSIDGEPEAEMVTHRRYIPPQQASQLLREAGYENVRWVQNYDLATAASVESNSRPEGPFLIIAER
ncbi:MAG: class I SAM-dependent methyltransferase [bacterium]|nr:class I SAM-dependent methyltransferase [bacterium]